MYKDKIIHISVYSSKSSNGVITFLDKFTRAAFEMGKDIELISVSATSDSNSLPFFTHFEGDFKSFFIPEALKKYLLSIKDKIRYVQLHSVFLPLNYSLSKFLAKHSIAILLIPHGGYNKYTFERPFLDRLKKRIYFNLFELPILKRVKKFHLHSELEVEAVKSNYKNIKYFLLPNGVDGALDNQEAYEKKTDKNVNFLFLGRIDIYHKGLDMLLEALHILVHQKMVTNLHLSIIGPPKSEYDTAYLNNYIREKQLSEYVSILPPIYDIEEKIDVYSSHDIVIHTSRWEGFPLSLCEAIRFRKPMFVTVETNVADLVLQYKVGRSIGEANVDNITESMSDFLKSPDSISNLLQADFTVILEDLKWTNIVNKYYQYLD